MSVLETYSHISSSPIFVSSELPDIPEMGGFVVFSGIVRNLNEGKKVTHLEYEAYAPMANEMISNILADACKKWDLLHANCIHRVGKLGISEIAVIVETGSVHRAEAYESNRYIIDRVKHEVPIWKKEFYLDGSSQWSKGCVHESH
ncbi:molybdenum cofactor biosynthesis protein MoaE [Leptospira selangorensis]|uniref:Molybdopterin synthase catalytic subunit n=1 Tax=Leptospira selangorensis TaxID=2484982 RepID=A0A5F2C5Q7_9LEPT|nr:molybdenum cofactor biosynthesis protein MoaE [Leptospira selangorensis]TGM13957.1 molybdenum cofactor biosynthesis protein MoaE [Leptospira selangorensis]TGM27111.1 molybdenum cofactor biosynthesis protein MoaE [Leptospira selangorensis]